MSAHCISWRSVVVACCLAAVHAVDVASCDEPDDVAAIRAAIAKALPLLQRGGAGHMAERKCFACHSQSMPVMAHVAAADRDLGGDRDHVAEHVRFILRSLERGRQNYVDGKGQGGNVITAGYALWTLELAGHAPDETTTLVADYLIRAHVDDVHWRVTTLRPPAEGSHFAATFVALRGLNAYGPSPPPLQLTERLTAVRNWLQTTEAHDTEDRVFRLRALREVDADDDLIHAAAEELITAQQADGGWSQLPDMDSDAYAAATALTALHDAAGMSTADQAYRRGVRYLLDSQLEDGSWHVRSRSKPFQTYYESGYPHEKDQFLSIAAAGWAVTALANACPADSATGARTAP